MTFLQRRIIKPVQYSFCGLIQAWKNEEAFRVELILGIPLIIYALTSDHITTHKIFLCSSIFFVFAVELLNSGLEKTIDRISIEQHNLSKIVKDIGSAAVLISLLNFFVTWLLVLVSK